MLELCEGTVRRLPLGDPHRMLFALHLAADDAAVAVQVPGDSGLYERIRDLLTCDDGAAWLELGGPGRDWHVRHCTLELDGGAVLVVRDRLGASTPLSRVALDANMRPALVESAGGAVLAVGVPVVHVRGDVAALRVLLARVAHAGHAALAHAAAPPDAQPRYSGLQEALRHSLPPATIVRRRRFQRRFTACSAGCSVAGAGASLTTSSSGAQARRCTACTRTGAGASRCPCRLMSTRVTPAVLAMARPSDRLVREHDLVAQFKAFGHGMRWAMPMLVQGGAGGHCEPAVRGRACVVRGRPGRQRVLVHAGAVHAQRQCGWQQACTALTVSAVAHYNFKWADFGVPALDSLLDMVKVLASVLAEHAKAAVHCHSGLGARAGAKAAPIDGRPDGRADCGAPGV